MAHLSFQPRDNWLYRLHPLNKVCCVLAFFLFFSLHTYGLLVTLSTLAILILGVVRKVPLIEAFKALKSIWLLLAIVALSHLINNVESVFMPAADAIFRICGGFLSAAIFVTITSQSELIFLGEAFFWPLQFFGVHHRGLALAVVIAVRFFPVVFEEMDRIRMAQTARGARWQVGNGLGSNPFKFMPLIIPILTMSIRQAEDLALTMETRGYRLSGKRTRYRTFSLGVADFLIGSIIIVIVIFCFFRA